MLNLKQTAFAVLAFSSTVVYSGTMGPHCKGVDVSLPCEGMGWDLGARALYMKASTPTGYGQSTVVQDQTTLVTGALPTWGWGFQLESAFYYSTGNDFNVNWYHYRAGGVVNNLPSPVTLANPANFGSTNPLTVQESLTSVSPAWDQVNMEFAHHIDFGEHKFIRLHGGANFSRVGNAGYQYTYLTDLKGTYSQKTINYNSEFNGFGPRAGADLNYEWNNGVDVYATGAISLLAGSAKSSHLVRDWVPINGVPLAGTYHYSIHDSKVVPEFDTKLGAMYTYVMPQGDLSMDIGWAWAYYTNATLSGDYLQQTKSKMNSFGIQGLYFGLKWVNSVP